MVVGFNHMIIPLGVIKGRQEVSHAGNRKAVHFFNDEVVELVISCVDLVRQNVADQHDFLAFF